MHVTNVSEDDFFKAIQAFLTTVEGLRADPYVDSEGYASIGIGINLHNPVFAKEYLRIKGVDQTSALGVGLLAAFSKKYADNDTSSLKAAIAKIPGAKSTSITLDSEQVVELFKSIGIGTPSDDGDATTRNFNGAISHYGAFARLLKDNLHSLDLLDTREGLALQSMEFNAGKKLFGNGLVGALKEGDSGRARAWYEIVFNSNLSRDKADGPGVAKRRYEEGAIFGLYDPADVTLGRVPVSEALNVYGTLSGYDDKGHTFFQDALANDAQFAGKIAAANADLSSAVLNGTVLDNIVATGLAGGLQPAAQSLVNHYIVDSAAAAFLGHGAFDTTAFTYFDIQVADKNGDKTISPLSLPNQVPQTQELLIAQGGDVTLDGTDNGFLSGVPGLPGETNYALIGGTGNNAIYVGDGNDYVVAGTGSTIITGGSGEQPIGSGDDTIVLGGADGMGAGGRHTVWGGAGDDTYFLSLKNSDVVHLGSGTSSLNFVDDKNPTIATPISLSATSLSPFLSAPGKTATYLDKTSNQILFSSKAADNTTTLRILGLTSFVIEPPATNLRSEDATEAPSWSDLIDGIMSLFAGAGAVVDTLDTESIRGLFDNYAPSDSSASSGTGILEIDGYDGSNLAGVTLDNAPEAPTGNDNLSQLRSESAAFSGYTNYYNDALGGTVASIFGSDAAPGTGYTISGSGNATYIQTGKGAVNAFLGDLHYTAANPLDIDVQGTIQGNSGSQDLIGVGNGHETIIGGSSGEDTSVWTSIDAGGADALLIGGGQNSVIWGGTGHDTIVASSIDSTTDQPYNPTTLAVAGLTFYGQQWYSPPSSLTEITDLPGFSVAAINDPGDFQVQIQVFQSDGTYSAPIGLLGSTYVPAYSDGDSTLPGSVMIGGSGFDMLIGNSGNDTITGGDPAAPQSGVIDEILVGGAGSDLIYGGSGTEVIFADMSPGAAGNWADLDAGHADTIYGGSGDAYIYGSGADNVIHGGSGNYTIYVGNGDSYVETGDGNTIVYGGSGNNFIVAGNGFDSIEAGDGDTYVYGGDGQSTIFAGAGDDTFEAGDGTTAYWAGSGHETLLLGGSGGDQQLINTSLAAAVDIRFTPDIDPTDIVARRDEGGNLQLINQVTGRILRVDGYFSSGSGAGNITVTFNDGTVWDGTSILANSMKASTGDDDLWGTTGDDVIVGGLGNDTIRGISGNDILTGGSGNNTVYGGTGNSTIVGGDGTNYLYGGEGNSTLVGGGGTNYIEGASGSSTYVFELGNGSDTINPDRFTSGADVLQFGEGIDPQSVKFASTHNGADLVVTFGGLSPSTVTVVGFFSQASGSGHHVQSVQFSDGSSLTAAQVSALAASNYSSDNGNDNIQGGSGDSHIYGGSGSDTLTGGAGNATIIGGSGDEVITGGAGLNVLVGGSGYDTIIAGGNGDNIDAGSGIAQVRGGVGNDTVASHGALASIEASDGLDTYGFGIGSGQLSLNNESNFDVDEKGGDDAIQIAAGLSSADLTFTRVGDSYSGQNALVIGIKGTNDYFKINDYFLNEYGIDPEQLPLQIRFANGEVMAYQEVEAAAVAASHWNGAVSDMVPELPGVDPSAADYFDRGDGDKALDYRYNLTPDDVSQGSAWEIRLGQGVRQQDISLTAHGTDVVLAIRGTSDTLLIPGILNTEVEGYAATQLTFADGSVWDVQQVVNHTDRGPGVASTLNLADEESITFGYGDGQKIVNVSDSSGNTLVFGPGIRSTDVIATRTAHGVEFILKSSGESITLIDESGGSDVSDDGNGHEDPNFASYPVEHVKFADGAVWETRNIYSFIEAGTSVEELESHTPRAPSAVDVITTGMDDNDVFVGSGDSLVLIGNGYADTTATTVIHAGPDFGNTTIEGSYDRDGEYGLGDSRVLEFDGVGVADLDISRTFDDRYVYDGPARGFSSDGSGYGNLTLTSRSTGRQIVVPYRIDTSNGTYITSSITGVSFADGSSLDIDALIGLAIPKTTGVEGTRGSHTLQAADGEEIRAALGNTVLVGSHQRIEADVSHVDPAQVPSSFYILSSGSTSDTIIANIYSTLTFGFSALSGSYAIIQGVNGDEILYRKDNGNFVSLAVEGQYIGDPDGGSTSIDLTIKFSDKTLQGKEQYDAELAQSAPLALADVQGRLGYYIDSINTMGYRIAYVRGSVSNKVFDGLGWSGFDASAAGVVYDLRGLHTQIDAVTNTASVNFTFASGLGNARVFNFDSARFNIDFAAGISAGDVSVVEDDGDVRFVVTSANGRQDTLEVDNLYGYSSDLQDFYEKQLTLHFADGTSWTNADVHARAYGLNNNKGVMSSEIWIVGSHPNVVDLSGQDSGTYTNVIIKSDTRNTLELGTDFVNATLGQTTFLVGRRSQAKISGFDSSKDDIGIIDGLTVSDVGVVRSSEWDSQSGRYLDAIVLVDRQTGRNLLTVSGSRLFLDDEPVVSFTDGTSWSFAELARSVPFSMNSGEVGSYQRGEDGESSLTGSSGNDIIAAGAGTVTIDGAGGADILYAGAGDDTFVFGAGYGQATIVGAPGIAHNNVLSLGAGIAAGDIEVARADDGSNVELRLLDTGGRVLLANFFDPSGDQPIQSLHFADGSSWSAADMLEKSYQGGETSKYIAANASHESVAGGNGNDTIIGDEAQDTLAGGAGQNVIRSGGGNNRIQLGAGSDTVYGGDGTDVMFMGAGNAVVYGGTGAEAFVFGASFGSSTVYAADNAVSNDIQFTDGIVAQDVSFAMAPDSSLHITLDNGHGSIVLPGHVLDSTTETDVHRIYFSDGSATSMTTIDALLAASGGNPIHAAPDILDAGLPAGYDPANSIHVAGAAQVAPSRSSHMVGSGDTASEQEPGDSGWHQATPIPETSAGGSGKSVSSGSAEPRPGAGDLAMSANIASEAGEGQSSFHGHVRSDPVDESPHGGSPRRRASPHAGSPDIPDDGRSTHGDPGIRIRGRLGSTPIRTGAPRDGIADPTTITASDEDGSRDRLIARSVHSGGIQSAGLSRHRRAVARTSDAADAMVKALVAQQSQIPGLQSSSDGLGDRADLTMALLGNDGEIAHASNHGAATAGHERLIQAMASFAVPPGVSSVSSSTLSEADAITLTVHAH